MIRILFCLTIIGCALAGCGSGEVVGKDADETTRTEQSDKAKSAVQATPESVTKDP